MISIIIPTYNERENIGRVLESLAAFPVSEILVVDGQSADQTFEHAASFSIPHLKVISSPKGRSIQMNAGAAMARGDWFLFLHADTVLPEHSFKAWFDMIRNSPDFVGGGFKLRFSKRTIGFRYLEWYVHMRGRALNLATGDQAIFVRRDIFNKIGGFREDFPIMEDIHFVESIRRFGRFKLLDEPVITSTRRHEKDGFPKRITLNFIIQVLYLLNIHPQTLEKLYK